MTFGKGVLLAFPCPWTLQSRDRAVWKEHRKKTSYAFASQGAALLPRLTLDGKINRETKSFYYLQQLLERISIARQQASVLPCLSSVYTPE